MTSHFRPELYWLAAVAAMTGLLWIPYIANRIRELGPPAFQWFPPADPAPIAPWAGRAMRAHSNAVENLAIFAPLALAVVAAGVGDASTALASEIYFWARLAHWVVCLFGFPILPRTVAFLIGVACQLTLGWKILSAWPVG